MTKSSSFVVAMLIFITSCDDLKVSDEIDKINPEEELIEGIKYRIFNQPDSLYQNSSSRVFITELIDSVLFSNCRGLYQDGYLFNDIEFLPMYKKKSDTNLVKLAFSKRTEKEDSINSTNLFPNEFDWAGNEVRIIPVEMNIDDNTRELVKRDKNLPYYFKKSILYNIPVYLYLKIRNVNYKGNSFEDGGLSKNQIGKTYQYGNYESKDVLVSVSFMYFEPKNDTLSNKYNPTLLIRNPNEQPFRDCKYLNSCCNNQTNWFGFFEVGRMDYRLSLRDLKVLQDDFKYFENAPADIDINYSGAVYFNEKAIEIDGWGRSSTVKYNDISVRLINCITNIPLDLKNRDLFSYNGGFIKNYYTEGNIKYFSSIYTSSQEDQQSNQEIITNNTPNNISGKYKYASERILKRSDIENLEKFELKLIRNEIYARHGYIFKSSDMKAYFESQSWYTPKYNDITSYLTETEKRNIDLIKSYE